MNLPWTWETRLLLKSGPHWTPGARALASSALFALHFFEHPTCKLIKDNLRMDIGIETRKGRLSFDTGDFHFDKFSNIVRMDYKGNGYLELSRKLILTSMRSWLTHTLTGRWRRRKHKHQTTHQSLLCRQQEEASSVCSPVSWTLLAEWWHPEQRVLVPKPRIWKNLFLGVILPLYDQARKTSKTLTQSLSMARRLWPRRTRVVGRIINQLEDKSIHLR